MRFSKDSHILVDALHRLPGFPPALMAVIRACACEVCSVAEIAEAVGREEVLASQVVRAANMAALGAAQVVDNVVLAVGRLGSSAVRGLAVAQFLSTSLAPNLLQSGLDRRALWRHHLAVAAGSSGAAGHGSERSDAHLAGLVHDVGRLIFAAHLGGRYAECMAEADETGEALVVVEARQFGLCHAELGAEAARQWKFAPAVVEAMAHHHDAVNAAGSAGLALSVMVADEVANAGGYSAGVGGPCLWSRSDCDAPAGTGARREGAERALAREAPLIEALLTG